MLLNVLLHTHVRLSVEGHHRLAARNGVSPRCWGGTELEGTDATATESHVLRKQDSQVTAMQLKAHVLREQDSQVRACRKLEGTDSVPDSRQPVHAIAGSRLLWHNWRLNLGICVCLSGERV